MSSKEIHFSKRCKAIDCLEMLNTVSFHYPFITALQMRVLLAIAAYPGMSSTELAEHLEVNFVTLNSVVTQLSGKRASTRKPYQPALVDRIAKPNRSCNELCNYISAYALDLLSAIL